MKVVGRSDNYQFQLFAMQEGPILPVEDAAVLFSDGFRHSRPLLIFGVVAYGRYAVSRALTQKGTMDASTGIPQSDYSNLYRAHMPMIPSSLPRYKERLSCLLIRAEMEARAAVGDKEALPMGRGDEAPKAELV
jgi:hypothetical protein